jgi:hypothetical protein
MPYQPPRCECHECTQARAADRAQPLQLLPSLPADVYLGGAPCSRCGCWIPYGVSHGCYSQPWARMVGA